MLAGAAFDHSANGHPIDERSLESPRSILRALL
jgi:hypothetical protein